MYGIRYTETVSVGVRTDTVSSYALHYTPFLAELQVLFENLQEKFSKFHFRQIYNGCFWLFGAVLKVFYHPPPQNHKNFSKKLCFL